MSEDIHGFTKRDTCLLYRRGEYTGFTFADEEELEMHQDGVRLWA